MVQSVLVPSIESKRSEAPVYPRREHDHCDRWIKATYNRKKTIKHEKKRYDSKTFFLVSRNDEKKKISDIRFTTKRNKKEAELGHPSVSELGHHSVSELGHPIVSELGPP